MFLTPKLIIFNNATKSRSGFRSHIVKQNNLYAFERKSQSVSISLAPQNEA